MSKPLFLKRWLLQGIVVVFPVFLTGFILYLIIDKTDQALWFVCDLIFPNITKPNLPGLGLLTVVTLLLIIGAFTETWLINQCVKLFNLLLSKVPVIRSIYTTILQIVESITNRQNTFNNAVIIEYPKENCYSLAFLTGDSSSKFKDSLGKQDLVNVFLPTTPNPTSGFYLIIPKNKIISTNISAEEAFKLIISAGIVQEEAK